ncbi:uncharacterized protein LOC113512452 isoform X2 [Galleria mellonella]|uniref:Uncharacterized protein LOC113512452 isoform X2 n=1 Tax=Galleria mellonella TaxID=7137 RepID=A0A6J1WM38_GALME|nr:uncharacterized protein LOC113512452 isoform X2 [Galleria mellonella]
MSTIKASSDSDGPIIDDNIIRIQLRKPCQRKWELRTRNLSPGIKFPTIQLFDCDGNLLVETNNDNISIKSSDFDERILKTSQSLKEKDYKHYLDKKAAIRKHNTISGDKVYTRIYRVPVCTSDNNIQNNNHSYIIRDGSNISNIPSTVTLSNNFQYFQSNSLDTTPYQSDGISELSSYKSSDNDTYDPKQTILKDGINIPKFDGHAYSEKSSKSSSLSSLSEIDQNIIPTVDETDISLRLHKSKSFNDTIMREETNKYIDNTVQRSKSGVMYLPPHKKVSFLNTYLKSLPARRCPNPDWFTINRHPTIESVGNSRAPMKRNELPKFPANKVWRSCKIDDNMSDNEFINIPTDVAADYEMKKRLKMYRRGISEIEVKNKTVNMFTKDRRHSVSGAMDMNHTSSSESVDEADVVLNRLKRRILKNKIREKRRTLGEKFQFYRQNCNAKEQCTSEKRRHEDGGAHVRSRHAMGSNISQHSAKGLKGRRARSSGDLCNGDSKSQTESSVCGSVVGDVMGWNRSLPNHLDGNRHLADYSRVNNNYGEFATYNRCHSKGRGLRYRVSKSGSDAEPVWKLQDPGFDQGYGSERSPEDDYVPPIVPPISLEAYEAELRTVYPFINDENTFTVVVEKDGRGLGMSVCGGGGLVKIRRLYPPQPAWRTGRLAPRDLLLSANGVPLAGLSTYEALEVLRTASPRVELRVCRPPPDALESVTPPDPPTPPTRTPHPPHLPPLDPLNCHPMHARLSQTTSSATTSSSEGKGRREASPEVERRDLRLPDLDRPLPVYDVQYGEFDIVMTKVNGSLGFTLRKEDHSALGHYVRALVREPALSDGRIQPGDRIVAVNDTSMSNMSHGEAVAFLRACGSEVRLRLYRDHAATPLSPMSPKEGPTDSDAPTSRPKPPLRPEAVSMLCDLAARRLTPDAVDGSRSPCLSPRKFRKLTKETNHYEQPNDVPSTITVAQSENSEVAQEVRRPQRAHTVTLASPTAPPSCRKQKLSLTVPPHGYELNNLDNDTLDAPNVYQEDMNRQRYNEPVFPVDSDEPVSMPAELSNDEARFKHSNPAYQSAVLHSTSSDTNDTHKDEDNGLKKWKGVALSPDNERKTMEPQPAVKDIDAVQKENIKPEDPTGEASTEPTIVTVELNRGWNSRLGFSVQSHPESGQSYISAVYNDSVAARDGRLRRGDVILQVNDENVTSMKTPEVIDLLRILRGSICITVLRPPNPLPT